MNPLSSSTTHPDKPTKLYSQAAGYLLNSIERVMGSYPEL